MEELWYEEMLMPDEAKIEEAVKSASTSKDNVDAEIRNAAIGIVRVDRPRWGECDLSTHKLLASGSKARFFLVRLGFQFDVPPEARVKGASFIYARCQAYLWPIDGSQPQPIVYDVIPRDLYEGEAQKVSVKVGPQIKLDKLEASLGEVSSDFTVGTIEPVVVGWTGENERAPYWDLRPKGKSLLGLRHLWLIVEVPSGCTGVQLATLAEGDVQTHFGIIPVGPKSRVWDGRYSVVIS